MSAKWFGIFAVLSFVAVLGTAHADSVGDAASIRLTTDQTKIIRLQQDAANVIVNAPAHASVSLDSSRLLIITPHEPGATSMIVLDKDGKKILQRDIIVSNVQKKYVRIRRMCGAGSSSCAPTSYSYCPDGCYEVTTVPASAAGAPPPSTSPGTIGGEPAETLLGPADDCPEGYDKVFVPGITSGDQHYTCTKR